MLSRDAKIAGAATEEEHGHEVSRPPQLLGSRRTRLDIPQQAHEPFALEIERRELRS
jgi:hypothetical protein